ncbi:MAG: 3-dehydroquinate synthase II [Candidatus Bathyarchaeota archaeon]|nr:3-dehydroquinate synthase II [Candidatus Bathyarchaeota archaeon]
MKEIWIEISSDISASEKLSIMKLAKDNCDYLLQNNHIERLLGKDEIILLESIDENKIRRLRSEGKKTALKFTIEGKEDENRAAKAAELLVDYILLTCMDWCVIPLENLIAKSRNKSKLIAEVSSFKDAKLVLEALELGTDGVLLKTSSSQELEKTIALVKKKNLILELQTAKIVAIKQIGTGARVCVDTCDLMIKGEGMLVGCQSSGLFHVEAEVTENPYVQARPFRVNAGSLSMYTFGSLDQTRYLSDLKAGEQVLIVDKNGKVRTADVGRVKIELRPLILIEAEAKGKRIKTILQNAETIRLVTKNNSVPVTDLKVNDEVLVHLTKGGGRHFGVAVDEETVIER